MPVMNEYTTRTPVRELGVGEGEWVVFFPQECLDSSACSPYPVPVVAIAKAGDSEH